MKALLKKVLHGLLIGIGFSVALGTTYYFVTKELTESAMSAYSFDEGTVEVIRHKKIEREGKLLIIGRASNTGNNQAKGVNIIVDLYLNGEFVKQCDEIVKGGIPAGDSRNFEISCGGGCKNNPIVQHDAYEIYVSGY